VSLGGISPERREALRQTEEARTRSWLREYLRPLLGGTIIGVTPVTLDGEIYAAMEVRLDLRTLQALGLPTAAPGVVLLRVQSDPEGNGPGWLGGLEHLREPRRSSLENQVDGGVNPARYAGDRGEG
jgi:hypothetical protein